MEDEIEKLLQRACDIGATKIPPNTVRKICPCGWLYPTHIQTNLVMREPPKDPIGIILEITCPRCGTVIKVTASS